MSANSFDASEVLAGLEEFYDTLPARKRRRPAEERYDDAPEAENYGVIPEPPLIIELDAAGQAQLLSLLRQLGLCRNDVLARALIVKLLAVLGLKLDGGAE